MQYLITRSLSIFFMGLEVLLFIQIFLSLIPIRGIRDLMGNIVEPILRPFRFLLNHSVFQSGNADSSPIIAFIVFTYFGQLLSSL